MKRFQCPVCPRSFGTGGGLATHARSHAQAEQTTLQPGGLDSMTLAELVAQAAAVDRAIHRAVHQMRSAPPGEEWRKSSWADIAVHLGVTRQAAQQRYGKKPTGPAPDDLQLRIDTD